MVACIPARAVAVTVVVLMIVSTLYATGSLGTGQSPIQRESGGPSSHLVTAAPPPPILPGTFVTIDCWNGTLWVNASGASIRCHDTVLSEDLCDTTKCTFTLTARMDALFSFEGWNTSGQTAVAGSELNPTSLYVYTPNIGSHYTGNLLLCDQYNSTTCGSAGVTCVAPSEGTPTDQIQSGYRQAWVNWTFTGTNVLPGFTWNPVGDGLLAIPQVMYAGSHTWSINLNDLQSDRTYDYAAGVLNGCGTDTLDGYFSTSNAPTTTIVGWVYPALAMDSEPFLVNQIGPALADATVSINASCPVEISDSWAGSDFFPILSLEHVAFPPVSATSTGSYSLGFPEASYSYTVIATGFVNIPVTAWDTLSSSGACTAVDQEGGADSWLGQSTSFTGSNYLLDAAATGRWNATEWVGSRLTVTNDFQQFGLEANGESYTFLVESFVHTTYASCGETLAEGASQTIETSVAGQGSTNTQNFETVTTAPPVSNGVSEIDIHYHTTGVMNQTKGAAVTTTYSFGAPFDSSENAVSPADPYSSAPAGANITTVGSAGGGKGWYTGGSFTSTSGLDMSVGVDASWYGIGIDSVFPVVYQTSVGTSTQNEISCTFTDPAAPLNEDTQFYWVLSGTAANADQYAVDLHVWLDDYCTPPGGNCN